MSKPDRPDFPQADYLGILRRADEWYRSCKGRYPAEVPCEKGCRDCCLGLFDISLADRDLLRQGLAAADEATRRDIEARASRILAQARAVRPDLEETLDGWSPEEIDDIGDAVGLVECPVLGREGECRLYEHRPLVCRLTGPPLVDLSGEVINPKGCVNCKLRADDAPRLDCRKLRGDERRHLKRAYGHESGVTLFIPQALAPDRRT